MLTFLSVRFGNCQIVLSVFMWPFNVKDVTVVSVPSKAHLKIILL
jgi:hypothetical protein